MAATQKGNTVHIAELEKAINDCREALTVDPASATALNAMATLYGGMIYRREQCFDMAGCHASLSAALSRWLSADRPSGKPINTGSCNDG